jgi:hypothetical protein
VVADAGGGAADVVGGAAHIEVATFEQRAKDAQLDGKQAQFDIERIDARMKELVDVLKQSYESSAAQLSAVATMQRENGNVLLDLAGARV